MRAATLIVIVAASAARAETAFGGHASLLAQQEAAGTFQVTASPQVRVTQRLTEILFVSVAYAFAYFPSDGVYGIHLAVHDVSARVTGRIGLPKSFLDIELGPVLKVNHLTTVFSGVESDSRVRLTPGGVAGLFLAVPINRLEFRAGTEFEFNGRIDVRFSFGLMWWLS